MITREELVKIGTFNKPHGVQGELSCTFTNTVFDRSECPYIVCEIDGIFVPFFIEEYRFCTETSVLMRVEDIQTEEDARLFTGRDIYFPKSYISEEEIPESPVDYFLQFVVYDERDDYLGRIVDVDTSTANTLFVVEREGKEKLLLPATDDLIVSVDEKKKKIKMKLPEGLLDL
ncbi:MAG: ribosome maturation factor RimM [Porphyromonadaceae bacterium]|nr:ribosome maturation factor RimM [Porphyromonadaceae bacterium]